MPPQRVTVDSVVGGLDVQGHDREADLVSLGPREGVLQDGDLVQGSSLFPKSPREVLGTTPSASLSRRHHS